MALVWANFAVFGSPVTKRHSYQHFYDCSVLDLSSKFRCGNRPSTKQVQSVAAHIHEQRSRNAIGTRSAQITDLRTSSLGLGPRGMLLVGFSKDDGDTVAAWMQQMEPGFPVSHCTPDLLKRTVQEAVCQGGSEGFRAEGYTVVDEPLPRLVLLCGMSGEETIAIAEHWDVFTGTATPIIATLVENLLQRSLQDAIMDIVKSFSISKNRSKNVADTAGLREMIKKKLDQRQAQAGRRLIGREAQSSEESGSRDSENTVYIHQRIEGMPSEVSSGSSNSKVEQEHQKINAAQQQLEDIKSTLPKSTLPKRAKAQRHSIGRREQKPIKEKRGFG